MDTDKLKDVTDAYEDGNEAVDEVMEDGSVSAEELKGLVAKFKSKKGIAAIVFAVAVLIGLATAFLSGDKEEAPSQAAPVATESTPAK